MSEPASALSLSPQSPDAVVWRDTPRTRQGVVDIDFSLALHNRTGKFFIGRDIIAANKNCIRRVRYWRLSSTAEKKPPRGLSAKLLGRMAVSEIGLRLKAKAMDRLLPRLRPRRAVIHLDPLTVLFQHLSADDVVLCHDIGPITHSDLFDADVVAGYKQAYREIAAAAPHMVFVSRASERTFLDHVTPNPASSTVIYPSLRTELGKRNLEPMGLMLPYLLTVGYVGIRKNQRVAIEAFHRSGLAELGVSYVICGGRETGYEDVAKAAAATPGVVLLDYVRDGELNWLYANAAGFVLPSLLEGFGIPVAEANQAGLIPLVSRDSVLQEVAGEGALLVNPTDPADIARAMRQLFAMEQDEKNRRRHALMQSVARFSQDAFLKGWHDVIEEAARRNMRLEVPG